MTKIDELKELLGEEGGRVNYANLPIELSKIAKEIYELTDANAHTDASLLLAQTVGTTYHKMSVLKELKSIQDTEGTRDSDLLPALIAERNSITRGL